jgi:hypothetical protein
MEINKKEIYDARVVTSNILLVIHTLALSFLLSSFTLYFFIILFKFYSCILPCSFFPNIMEN